MEDNDYINEHLRDTLGRFRVQPKISSFDEVLKKMQKKKRRRFFFFLFPGLLILTGALFVFMHATSSTSPVSEMNNIKDISNTSHLPAQRPRSSVDLPKGKQQENTPSSISQPKKVSAAPQTTAEKITISPGSSTRNTENTRSLTKSSASLVSTFAISRKNDSVKEPAPKTVNADITQGLPGSDTSGTTGLLADHLIPTKLLLSSGYNEKEASPDTLQEIALFKKDSVAKAKKIKIFVGAYFTPQLGACFFSKNRTSSIASQAFTEAYLKNKKEQNALIFNYGFGFKAGFLWKDTWELLAGFGFQNYFQKSKGFAVPGSTTNNAPTLSGSNGSVSSYDAAPDPNGVYKSAYRYYDVSLGISRMYTLNRFFKIKAGFGLDVQKIRRSSQVYEVGLPLASLKADANTNPLSKWLGNVNVKAGLIENITSRLQFQVCPNLYCSPTSMFNRSYLIKQRNFGLGMECLLLFRLR